MKTKPYEFPEDERLFIEAEGALLDLTEAIVRLHGQYTGRYYWLWRLLEWTADKLIWRGRVYKLLKGET